MLNSFSVHTFPMSKRSKRTGAGRGFGKPRMVMEPEDMVGLITTVFALQLASERLAELDSSKTAKEWQDFLMEEAAERILSDETFGLSGEEIDLNF
jgi:hypothetical protein